MRTTLTIDDALATALKQKAHDSGQSFKQTVNQALLQGLAADSQTVAKPYRLKPISLGAVNAGFDLNKALTLADELEDEAIKAKLEQRK